MLNLNQLDIDISFALSVHKKHLCEYTKAKLDAIKKPSQKNYSENELIKEFLNLKLNSTREPVDNSIEMIIGGKHNELRLINSRFIDFVNSKSTTHFDNETYWGYINTEKRDKPSKAKIHRFFLRLEAVFSYTAFGDQDYSKYKLTENLKVRTCIYCNRMYALTHYKTDGSNLMNPQLDHWLPKSKYPLLQVSFFNLIPSCDICNSRIKKVKEFKENDHVHPYDDIYEEIKFTYYFDQTLKKHKITFENTGGSVNKVRDTFEYIHVHDMYNGHIPELTDLLKIKQEYGDTYLEKLNQSFPSINISKDDRYRLAFGVEIDPKKFHLYPLSKFKYDILKELKII